MKKFLLLAAIAVLMPAAASAQSAAIGFKGGVNFATFGGDDASSFFGNFPGGLGFELGLSNRTAFVVGGFVTLQLDDYFALQPELLYVSRGTQIDMEGSVFGVPFSEEATFTINYIEIPVLAKLTIPTGTPAIPFLYAGPSLAIKAGEATFETSSPDSEPEEDFDDDIKSTDFGVALGGGLGLNLGGGMLSFDVRYTLGLSTIVKSQEDEEDNDDDELDLMNRSLSLSLGFSFFL